MRQVADAIAARAKQIADRRLAFGDAVEVAHGAAYGAIRAGGERRVTAILALKPIAKRAEGNGGATSEAFRAAPSPRYPLD
jgi:hypothetical protein